jgi:hypothetical protein
VKPVRPSLIDDDLSLPGPFDPGEADDLWFLPSDDAEAEVGALSIGEPMAPRASLVDADGWRAAEAALAGDLAELSFDRGGWQNG